MTQDKITAESTLIMKIGQPSLSVQNGRARITSVITFGDNVKELWFEVEGEYGRYLCYERSDAYLIGLLWIAMVNHYDIECEAPVTGELLHQVETVLIPSLVKNSGLMRKPKITCPIEPEPLPNAGAVGTGMSCGVDSFHAVVKHHQHILPDMRLTHLAVFNVGAFGLYDIAKAEKQFQWQVGNSRSCAEELGLKLVVGNSNFKEEFFTDHRCTCTYVDVFAIFMLQKLWKAYFYASAGWDMTKFSVKDADRIDAAHYDLLAFDCYSTRSLRIYSEGMSLTRFEKTRDIVDFALAQEYLQVCCQDDGRNCGRCFKCKRTLVCLDALDALDKYRKVFDVDYYISHRFSYITWFVAQIFGRTQEYDMQKEVFGLLKTKGDISWRNYVLGVPWGMMEFAKGIAKNSLFIYRFYRRIKGLDNCSYN